MPYNLFKYGLNENTCAGFYSDYPSDEYSSQIKTTGVLISNNKRWAKLTPFNTCGASYMDLVNWIKAQEISSNITFDFASGQGACNKGLNKLAGRLAGGCMGFIDGKINGEGSYIVVTDAMPSEYWKHIIAHEYGHYLSFATTDLYDPNSDDLGENYANAFASVVFGTQVGNYNHALDGVARAILQRAGLI